MQEIHFSELRNQWLTLFGELAGVEINIFRWLHLGLEGGYRFVTSSDISLSDRQLSNAFGQATLKFGFSWGRYRKQQDHDNNNG